MIKCPKCKIKRNELESPECSVCKFGKPNYGGRTGNFRFEDKIYKPASGGPKPKIKICPKCKFKGFATRNKSGRMCMCGGCGRRVF